MIYLKTAEEIEKMKAAGAVVSSVFHFIKPYIHPGISTAELDLLIRKHIESFGATPSFLNYGDPPFPASSCISINEEVVHGIPSGRKLEDGDIVSVDVGAFLNGYHGDACRTFLCGNVSEEWQKLVRVTEESFWAGIKMARPGNRLGDISHAIQEHCEKEGYGIVRDYTGHGIGREMHEDPPIFNYGRPGRGVRLEAGMCLAIEPMVTLGDYRVYVKENDWTVATVDGSPAAHYENSLAITDGEPIILTRCHGV